MPERLSKAMAADKNTANIRTYESDFWSKASRLGIYQFNIDI